MYVCVLVVCINTYFSGREEVYRSKEGLLDCGRVLVYTSRYCFMSRWFHPLWLLLLFLIVETISYIHVYSGRSCPSTIFFVEGGWNSWSYTNLKQEIYDIQRVLLKVSLPFLFLFLLILRPRLGKDRIVSISNCSRYCTVFPVFISFLPPFLSLLYSARVSFGFVTRRTSALR